MSRSLYDAIRGNNEDEVMIRLNLGEDIDMRHPPRYDQRHGMSGILSFLSSSIISFDTPLHVAVEAGHENIVRILCERKAKLNFLNGKSEIPLTLANRYIVYNSLSTLLFWCYFDAILMLFSYIIH